MVFPDRIIIDSKTERGIKGKWEEISAQVPQMAAEAGTSEMVLHANLRLPTNQAAKKHALLGQLRMLGLDTEIDHVVSICACTIFGVTAFEELQGHLTPDAVVRVVSITSHTTAAATAAAVDTAVAD